MNEAASADLLKITVFAFDVPFPAHRGGRADIWRRLVALRALNCDLQLICWQNTENAQPNEHDLASMRSVVSDLQIFNLCQGGLEPLKRLTMLPMFPSHVMARRISNRGLSELLMTVNAFGPDAVWIEGPYPGIAAERVATKLGIPYFYRSHNIEHLYMARQAHAARAILSKVAWHLACIGLKRYETRLMANAKHVYDISADDMEYWRKLGIQHISCLPPLPERAIGIDPSPVPVPLKRDVVFLGNLSTPNNIRGVEFLLTEVAPLLLTIRPETRFTIAGSRPNDYVRQLVAICGSAELLEDVPDAAKIMESARVLVNPVRTGSGVMVKILDMLMTNVPIISSEQGACGLPEIVKNQLIVANDAASFSAAVIQAIEAPEVNIEARATARTCFSVARIQALRDEIAVMTVSTSNDLPSDPPFH